MSKENIFLEDKVSCNSYNAMEVAMDTVKLTCA